jgi:hypothetical protein
MQPVIKERQYQGTIDPLAHWLAEIKQHNNDDAMTVEQRKAMINYVLARLEAWKNKQRGV